MELSPNHHFVRRRVFEFGPYAPLDLHKGNCSRYATERRYCESTHAHKVHYIIHFSNPEGDDAITPHNHLYHEWIFLFPSSEIPLPTASTLPSPMPEHQHFSNLDNEGASLDMLRL